MIGRFQRSSLVRLFGSAVVDQAVLSGANFVVGFLLIRHSSDLDYGYFVLTQTAILLLTSAQGAWVSSPLSSVAPRKTAEERRQMVGVVNTSLKRFLLVLGIVAGLLVFLGDLVGLWRGLEAWVVGAGVLATWCTMRREYWRSILLIYTRPTAVLAADSLFAVVLVAGAIIAISLPGPTAVWAVLSLAVSALAGGWLADRQLARSPGWASGDARPAWRELRPLGSWALLSVVIYWAFGQGFNYMLATGMNVAAVATVNAARLLLQPTYVLTMGVRSLLIPSAATWLHESGLGKLIRRLTLFIVGIIVLDCIYFLPVWIYRDWFTGDLLHKNIPNRDNLMLMWAALSLTNLIRDGYQCALLALGRFKPMAWLTAGSAVVSLTTMYICIRRYGVVGSQYGLLAGEMLSLIGVVVLLINSVLQQRRAATRPTTAA